jgi:hypothetical protein
MVPTHPTDAQRRRAADPEASGQELADLAAAFPELHATIASNPAVYADLAAWIAAQQQAEPSPEAQLSVAPPAVAPNTNRGFRLGRRGVIAAVAAGALVIGGTGVALAVALARPPQPQAVPTSDSVPQPSRTPTPEPLPTEYHLDEPGSWGVYGDSLYRTETGKVSFFTPGVGITSYAIPDFDPLETTQNLSVRTDVTFTGPVDDLEFVALAFQRTPAVGTTPERYALVAISAPPGGRPEVHELWELVNTTYDGVQISTTSAAKVIAVAQDSGSSDDPEQVAGVDLATGSIIWRYPGGVTDSNPMMDTLLVMVDRIEGFSITGCWDGYGVRIATGEVLFRTELEPCSYWGSGSEDFLVAADQGNDYRVYDRITGEPLLGWVDQGAYNGGLRYDPLGHLGMTGDYDWREELRVFDTGTGEVVYSMPLSQVNALGLQADVIWDGKVYARTTDAMIVIDARSGDTLADSVTWYPLKGIGGWTLYSDGLITSEERPLT